MYTAVAGGISTKIMTEIMHVYCSYAVCLFSFHLNFIKSEAFRKKNIRFRSQNTLYVGSVSLYESQGSS